jgi:hypothetical protein
LTKIEKFRLGIRIFLKQNPKIAIWSKWQNPEWETE